MARYRGLSNQGATCYMNSLLQTLYMTPELRLQLYQWSYTESQGTKKDSIPYQLQLLFGRLQQSQGMTVDTKGLTRSFQWDVRDSFVQHDVQEFCRVLFDAIERSVKATSQSTLITDLYQGQLEDYVQCLSCHTESHRTDNYLDLSLSIRNQFTHTSNDSLQKSLSDFIKPEMLTGDNQYFCEKCNQKADAVKGLRFKTFPKLLVVQLKRFDLDMRTFMKKKLNDFVSFPFILDLNPYINTENRQIEDISSDKIDKSLKFPVPADIESKEIALNRYDRMRESLLEDRNTPVLDPDPLLTAYLAKKESDLSEISRYLEGGEYVYELFSVMVHSGSAHGGHYYAYICSFEDRKWYKFNDSAVSAVSVEEVKSTYGGGNKAYANAYLLTYRQVTSQPITSIPDSLIPEYIRLKSDKPAPSDEPDLHLIILYENQRKIHKFPQNSTLNFVFETILSNYHEKMPISDYRLRGYQSDRNKFLENSYQASQETLLSLNFSNYMTFVLEKKENNEFVPYDFDAVYVKIVVWKEEFGEELVSLSEKFETNFEKIALNRFLKVKNLMEKISILAKIDESRLLIIRKIPNYGKISTETISNPSNFPKTLQSMQFSDSTVLYIEENTGNNHWIHEFDLDLYRISIRFNHPNDKNVEFMEDLGYKVSIDGRLDVQTVKREIGKRINMDIGEFILRKGWKSDGQEVKNLQIKLNALNMGSGACLYVEKGTPIEADEVRVGYAVAGEAGGDGVGLREYDLGTVVVRGEETVGRVKGVLVRHGKDRYPSMHLVEEECVLREMIHGRLGRLLREDLRLRDLQLFDQSKLCLHRFPCPVPPLTPKDIILTCRHWHPSLLQLSPPIHLIVNKRELQVDFAKKLEELVGIPSEKLEVYKVTDGNAFTRDRLERVMWMRLGGRRERVEDYPLSLVADGYLLILKDRTEARSSITLDMKPSAPLHKPRFSWNRKEQGMTITVKNEQQEK